MTYEHLTYTGARMSSGAKASPAETPERADALHARSRAGRSSGCTRAGRHRRLRLRARPRRPRRVPLHARHPRHRLPRQALDDAAVCRVRHAGGHQPALSAAAGRGWHRAERRVRPADADGPGPRPSAVARRSGQVRRQLVSLADMETLFDGIPLGDVTTSMTINSPAPMLFAMYLVVAERQGVPWGRCRARSRTTS